MHYPQVFQPGCVVLVEKLAKLLVDAAKCPNSVCSGAKNHICSSNKMEIRKAVFNEECSTCRSAVGSNPASFSSIIVTGCHHVFCASCLFTSIGSSGQPMCPNCRSPFDVEPTLTTTAETAISQVQSLRDLNARNNESRLQIQFASSQSEEDQSLLQ